MQLSRQYPLSAGLTLVQDSSHFDPKIPHSFPLCFRGVLGECGVDLVRTSLMARTRPHSLSSPMLGKEKLCLRRSPYFYLYLPNTWKGFNLPLKYSTPFLGKLSHSKQLTSTKCTSLRGHAELLSTPMLG